MELLDRNLARPEVLRRNSAAQRIAAGAEGFLMLKGFSVPRSPQGAAALAPPPPWHYAFEVLAVEFWSDPDVSAGVLPQGVELDARSNGRSVAVFADCQFTASGEEYLDPARYQSREFVVLLDATWDGSPIAWCPYAYTDNDAMIMMGWVQGYPKKLGAIRQTRTFAAQSAASPPLARNSRFAACLSAHGQPLAEGRVVLHDKVDQLAGLFDRPIVVRRYFPRLSAGAHDNPVVDELVLCVMDNIEITNGWIGSGELSFPEAHGEELDMLGPIKMGRGYRFTLSFSVSNNEILADMTV
jgi:hypothetical protein